MAELKHKSLDLAATINGDMMAPLPLWFHKLTPELHKYAEDTLGETAEKKTKALSEFRRLIKGKKNLHCRDDDIFLTAFLRTKKFDVERAFKVLNNYYDLRAKYNGVLTGMLPSEVRKAGEMNAAVVLPLRLPPGYHINFIRIGKVDLKEATCIELIAFILIMSELLLECEASQVCGAVTILDFSDLTLQHYTQFINRTYISLVVTILQDCWPERVKEIHVLNEPTILRVFYKLFRPILTSKLKEKIHFHGKDLESLHQHIPLDYLPEELGGNLGPLDTTEFLSYIFSKESFFKKINSYGLVDKQ